MGQRVAPAVAVLAALALPSLALAGPTLTGTYTTKIGAPAELKGSWSLTFAKGGGYTVARAGQIVIRGKYSTSGSKITFSHETGPLACPKTGTYTWRRSGNTLGFARRSDAACTGRAGVLAHGFTRSS